MRTGPSPESGPTRFPARWQGKEGYAVVTETVVGWARGDINKEEAREMDWTLRIGEVHVSFGAFLFYPLFPVLVPSFQFYPWDYAGPDAD